MHSQDSAQIAEALFDAFNAHDLDRLEALTSDGFLGIGPDSPDLRMGRRGGRAWAAAYFAGVPDSKWTKERIFGQDAAFVLRSEEHTSELQSLAYLVCRLLLVKKKNYIFP